MFDRYANRRSVLALHFFLLSALLLALAGAGGWLLIQAAPRDPGPFRFPIPFWLSTIALATGSVALQRAVYFVRIERQRPFRSHLLVALVAGTLFVMFQTDGMWILAHSHESLERFTVNDESAILGVKAFVLGAAALHAMHFLVAVLVLVYVTLNGLAGRYDHEYYFGVRFCAWFWHALGAAWLVILAVYGIVLL